MALEHMGGCRETTMEAVEDGQIVSLAPYFFPVISPGCRGAAVRAVRC